MYRILSLLSLFSLTSPSIVKWLPNQSFSLSTNFKAGILPCSKKTVVFPEAISSAVNIDTDTFVKSLVLPEDGQIILTEGSIIFGEAESDNCTEGSVYYTPTSTWSWSQPGAWSSPRFNDATPDAERVPCYDDEVEFSGTKSQFTLVLPDAEQKVRAIKIDGDPKTTSSFKATAISNPNVMMVFVLNTFYETGVKITDEGCNLAAGCLCQSNVEKVDCSTKLCPKPKCADPVKPIGHCCDICGGYLTVYVNNDFKITSFTETVTRVVRDYGEDSVEYHIGRVPDNLMQIVVVDKGDYDGTSSQVVNEIEHLIHGGGFKTNARYSGNPSSKSGMGAKIVVSMFFAVVLVMGAIYAYYYKLPNVGYPIVDAFRGRGRGMMSRFDRRTDSVVSLARRDSTATIGSTGGTAFRNPLYDSKRGRVRVAEPVEEE